MADIVPPNAQQPISNAVGIMLQVFRTWANSITRLVNHNTLITGEGSPEGVVSAAQGRKYMDVNGTASNISYIKRDADVLGDETLGWILE